MLTHDSGACLIQNGGPANDDDDDDDSGNDEGQEEGANTVLERVDAPGIIIE